MGSSSSLFITGKPESSHANGLKQKNCHKKAQVPRDAGLRAKSVVKRPNEEAGKFVNASWKLGR